MKGELYHLQHPYRMRIYWLVFYVLIFLLVITGAYITTDRIRTHTIPSGKVELIIPYSKYLVGETISFTIKNHYNSPIYVVNRCPNEPLAVYRQENDQWVRQHDLAAEKDCKNQNREVNVPANGLVSDSFASWHNLFSKPGKYRVVAFVEYYNDLPYQDFEVIAAPPKATSAQPTETNQPIQGLSEEDNQPTASRQNTTPPVQQQPQYSANKNASYATEGGTLNVQYNSGGIYITSIAPAANCTYEGGGNGPQVQITFKCPGKEVQIQLNIVNGQIIPTIETGD